MVEYPTRVHEITQLKQMELFSINTPEREGVSYYLSGCGAMVEHGGGLMNSADLAFVISNPDKITKTNMRAKLWGKCEEWK